MDDYVNVGRWFSILHRRSQLFVVEACQKLDLTFSEYIMLIRIFDHEGAKQDELWDRIYDAFGGKVAREKIDGFKAAAGTLLYFYDETVVKGLQDQFPLYAANFPVWANQANGMLQINIWTALR